MFYDIFEHLCSEKGVKPGRAADEIGINRATVTSWKKNGYNPRKDILEKISAYFGVTVDYLMGNSEQKEALVLTKKDERDIAKTLEQLRETLESQEGLMFYGDPMSDEAKESILAAMELGLQTAKVKNKEKYTPKKYKKD